MMDITSVAVSEPACLRVAIASSLLKPIEDIGNKFTQKHSICVDFISASSGVLSAQIRNGAPYDLFISANMKYPLHLTKEGKTESNPKIFAFGGLLLWSRYPIQEKDLRQLSMSAKVQKIAIANPELAPYGEKAKNWMIEHNLLKILELKLVYGNNVNQVNLFIHSDVVELAFTSISAREMIKDRKGYWLNISEDTDTDLPHGVVVLSKSSNKKISFLFLNYLFEDEAKEILSKYGYSSFENLTLN